MRKALHGSLVVLTLLAFGCVPQKARQLIEVETFVHDKDLEQWQELTPAQRRESYQASRDSFHVLRHILLDKPLPADLK